KAGRYTPKCPKCGKAFVLLVSGDEGNYQFIAKVIEPKSSPSASPPKAEPKPAGSKAVAPVSKAAAAPPAAENIEATAAAPLRGEDDPGLTTASLNTPPAEPEAPAAYTFNETEVVPSKSIPVPEATRISSADDVAD